MLMRSSARMIARICRACVLCPTRRPVATQSGLFVCFAARVGPRLVRRLWRGWALAWMVRWMTVMRPAGLSWSIGCQAVA